MNKATKSSKEHTSRKELSGMYHELSNENKCTLTSIENEDLFESKNVADVISNFRYLNIFKYIKNCKLEKTFAVI